MPMSTLSRLPIDLSNMKKSQMVVWVFDRIKMEVLRNIELLIQVGPCTFDSEFIVMDINPSYNCLLRRPWIHMASAVPSTFHQKVKFVMKKNLITVAAEEDMIATTTVTTPNHDSRSKKYHWVLFSIIQGCHSHKHKGWTKDANIALITKRPNDSKANH